MLIPKETYHTCYFIYLFFFVIIFFLGGGGGGADLLISPTFLWILYSEIKRLVRN